MLMSHTARPTRVFIEYTVDVETDRRLHSGAGVLAARQRLRWRCRVLHQWRQRSRLHTRRVRPHGRFHTTCASWRRAAHLHGGAKDMWLSQPRCGERRLLDNRPSTRCLITSTIALVRSCTSRDPSTHASSCRASGIPATAGETIRLHAQYDGELPRAVMAVMHVYVARAPAAEPGCQPLPADRVELIKPGPTRLGSSATPDPVEWLGRTRQDLHDPRAAMAGGFHSERTPKSRDQRFRLRSLDASHFPPRRP